MRKKIVLVIMGLLSTAAYPVTLDMKGAIQMAYENNYDLQKSKRDLDIRKLDTQKAYKQIYPKITFTSSETKLSDSIKMTILGKSYEIPKSDYMYSNKLTLQQPLYMGGAIVNGIKYIEMNKSLTEIQADQRKREVKLEVILTYLTIEKLDKNKETLKNALDEMKKSYAKLEESYNLGLIQKKPLLEMKYRIADINSNIVSLEKEVAIKILKLKTLLGLAGSEDVGLKKVEIPDVDISKINLADDINFAKENKLSIKMVKLTKELSKINENVKFSDLLPKVTFRFNYEILGHESGSDTNNTWNANVTATMNVFDFGATVDEINKSKKETEKKEFDEKQLLSNTELGIKSAYSEIERLNNILEAKREGLESARENYKIEKQKFDLELNTSNDLLSAENDLRKIEIEIDSTKVDLYSAYIKYKELIEKEE